MSEPQSPEFVCSKLLSAERRGDGTVVLEFDTVRLVIVITCVADAYVAMFELMER
jgi:hypothetical protein